MGSIFDVTGTVNVPDPSEGLMAVVSFSVSRRSGGSVFVATGTVNVTETDDVTTTTSSTVTGTVAMTESDEATAGNFFQESFIGTPGSPPNPVYWDDGIVTAGSVMALNGNGQLEMAGGGLGAFGDRQYIRLKTVYANFDMYVDFRYPNTSAGHNPRIGWRGSGTRVLVSSGYQQTRGYTLYFSDLYDYWNIEEWTTSGTTTFKNEYPASGASLLLPGTAAEPASPLVHCRIQMIFNDMKIKVWLDAEPEPAAWGYETFDATYASGTMWLSHISGGDSNPDTILWEMVSITGSPLGASEPPPPPPPNQAPTDISLSVSSIEENAGPPRGIGVFSTTDPNAGDVHNYTLVAGTGDTNNNLFTIVGGQLKLAVNIGAQGTRSIRVRSTDTYLGGNLSVEKVFTITVTAVGGYLNTKAAILAAFQGGSPNILIDWGSYSFGAGEALKCTVAGQRVIGRPGNGTPAQTVELVCTGVAVSQYGGAGGGGYGVVSITPTANFCELGGFTVRQTLDRVTYKSPGENRPVVGIDSRATDYYIHDIVSKDCAMGFNLWSAAGPGTGTGGGIRRLHRVLSVNCGYFGPTYGHSGDGIYIQTPDTDQPASLVVDMEDFVVMEQTRMGIHDYGTFSMDAPRRIRGVLIVNPSSPVNTGDNDPSYTNPLYLAKAEDVEIDHGHFIQYQSGLRAQNKVGYGAGFYPEHFKASDSWFMNPVAGDVLTTVEQRWIKQVPTGVTWNDFDRGDNHIWKNTADQAAFMGVHPLGSTWSVCYGTVPGAYVQVPGSIAYPALNGLPAVTLVRPV